MGPIHDYLARAGLMSLDARASQIELAVRDLIDQFDTPVDMPDAALFRYRVPALSEDGSCSLLDELDPTPYDLAVVLGGASEAARRKLKLLNIVVARGAMVTGA
ncbi:MAG TPA: hypothetical protein VFV17_10495, partial [Usitatibacteraceae bacterium]|nr:hypothetical protein [Usitatibacteraceae bacterium]